MLLFLFYFIFLCSLCFRLCIGWTHNQLVKNYYVSKLYCARDHILPIFIFYLPVVIPCMFKTLFFQISCYFHAVNFVSFRLLQYALVIFRTKDEEVIISQEPYVWYLDEGGGEK